jgi:hypothetical protein
LDTQHCHPGALDMISRTGDGLSRYRVRVVHTLHLYSATDHGVVQDMTEVRVWVIRSSERSSITSPTTTSPSKLASYDENID